MATEAAWLECKESTGRKEKTEKANRKRKTHLTHTGLLMEGVENCYAACASNSGTRCPMTIETNRAVMQRFTEFINTASEKLAAELISPDAIFHVPGRSEPMRGPGGYLAIIGIMRGGFPDIQWILEEMICEGDKVAARFTMRGTHRGPFFGVPPSGKPIEVQAMNFYRLSGGQFVEERGQPDLLSVLQQIGAVTM
jgi:steroid delta-isomerase-like uncharacterized protein